MLYSLKELGYVHRDIKPDNILYKIKNNNDIEFQLADFSTCVPYNTITTQYVGTDEFIGPLFIVELKKNKNAKLKYSFDWYSMALTLFKMFIYFFNKNVVFKDTSGKSVYVEKYFPFTNDDSTIQSKISIWSNEEEYYKQEMLLQSFLDVSLTEILKKYYPSVLTEINKKNLQDDLLIIFRLFLSNNPFPNSNQYTEDATFKQIKEYLGISYQPPLPTN
jgi:serine/threonine protein kinase